MNQLSLSSPAANVADLDQHLQTEEASEGEVTDFLVTHFYASIHRLALSMLHSNAEADEVAQRTMIKAAANIASYRPGTNLRSWVYKIGVNEARMALRRQKSQARLIQLVTLGLYSQPAPKQPEKLLEQSERDAALWRAVGRLPLKQQLPILLRYSFDLSDQEIADVLSIPNGTVRSRLHTAHKRLHRELSQEDQA